jgi:uncharacterized protein
VPHLKDIQVFHSPVHGYGVIAKRDIQPGEVIADVEGILYRREELGDDTYCLWIDDDHYYDMVDQTRWINHSCEPNAEVEAGLDDAGVAWARVVAIRPIRASEEVTYHYGFNQELAEPCACRTSSCAGWIVDPDELPALKRRLARENRGRENGSQPTGTPDQSRSAPSTNVRTGVQ